MLDPVRMAALGVAFDLTDHDDVGRLVRDAEVVETYLRSPVVVRTETAKTTGYPYCLDGITDAELRRALLQGWRL